MTAREIFGVRPSIGQIDGRDSACVTYAAAVSSPKQSGPLLGNQSEPRLVRSFEGCLHLVEWRNSCSGAQLSPRSGRPSTHRRHKHRFVDRQAAGGLPICVFIAGSLRRRPTPKRTAWPRQCFTLCLQSHDRRVCAGTAQARCRATLRREVPSYTTRQWLGLKFGNFDGANF